MNLFSGIKKRQTIVKFGMQPIDQGILDRVVNYVEHLSLPISAGRIHIEMMEELEKGSGSVPYYMLLFTDGTEEDYFNAGYASGMASYFLRFQGISASVLRESPMRLRGAEYKGMRCTAALAFGHEPKSKETHRRAFGETETPCILREQREEWEEEVLNFSKEHFSAGLSSVQVIRQEKWIHFMRKPSGRKNSLSVMFEAGAAVAGIMASAEELWIDLALVNVQELLLDHAAETGERTVEKSRMTGARAGGKTALDNPFLADEYLVSVCRRKECRSAASWLLRNYSAASKAGRKIQKQSLWRYA